MDAESRTMYLSSSGWGSSPGGESVRLDSSAQLAQNRLWVFNGSDWVLANESTMTGLQRGFYYRISEGPNSLVLFDGVRWIDNVVLSGPLKGRVIYDHEGRVAPNPLHLGYRFCLSVPDAKAFTEAVKGIGGQIVKENSHMSEQVRGYVDSQIARLKEIVEQDFEFVQLLVGGQMQNRVPFDQRGETFKKIQADLRSQELNENATNTLNQLREARERSETVSNRFYSKKNTGIEEKLLFSDLFTFLSDKVQAEKKGNEIIIAFPEHHVTISDQGAKIISLATGEVTPATPAS